MDDAIKALDASLFDLIVVVLDRLTAPHLRLIQHLSHNVTATPVTVLIKSVEQERFHQIVSDVDIDWTLVSSYDHVSDLTLTRAIQRSITRSEQRWERSQMQRAFKSSLLQYRSLFDEVPDVIFICDRSGCLLDVNDTVARVFEEDLVHRRSPDSLVEFETSDQEHLASFLKTIDKAGVLERKMKVPTDDGRQIIVQVSINRLRAEAPGDLLYVGITRDVTEQKKLEQLLKLYNENLQEVLEEKTRELEEKHIELVQSSKLATLGEMATGIAHELNQPLSGIRTRAQLLSKLALRGRIEAENVTKNQNEIIALVDRISRIVQHMRVFARQDQQPFAPFNINVSIEGCLNLLGQQLRLHAIDLQLNVPENPSLILGEASQIEQVLLNLVGNARDAMDERAETLRRAGDADAREYRKRLSIELTQPSGAELRLSIRDNGIGMNPEVRERIFQPFFTTKAVGRGTGLGLSITYGIIAAHNGRIEVKSEPGEGSTFILYFPVCSMARGDMLTLHAPWRSDSSPEHA